MSDKKIDTLNIGSLNTTSPTNADLTSVKDITELKSRICNYIDTAENYYITNFEEKWNYFDNLYNMRREKPEGAAPWRSNVASPLPFQYVQDELPKSLDGLIGDGDFFTFQPRPGKEHLSKKGKAYAELIRYFYDKADFFSKVHDGLLYSKKLGIGWLKQTWQGYTEVKENYSEKDGEIIEERNEEFKQGLCIEVLDPNRAFPDPDAETMDEVNKQGYFVEYTWMTREYVRGLKDKPGIVKTEFNDFIKMADEQDQFDRYQFYCVYTAREVYWLVTGNGADYLIRRIKNPYSHGHVPVYPIYKYRVPGQIVGTGIVEAIADISESFADAINLTFDNWILAVNKHIAVKDDIQIDPALQKIEPGTISRWTNPSTDVNVLGLGDVNPSSFNMLQTFMGMANQVAGSAAGITTPQGIQTVNNKTATGASILAYNEAQTVSLEVKINRDSFLKKILRDGVDLINQYIDDEMVKRILSPDKAALIRVAEDKDTFWDDFDFIIKGETGYVGKQREMEKAGQILQLIPSVEQIAAAVPGFNKQLYYDMVFSAMDVPKEIMKVEQEQTKLNAGDYTPQEQEKLQALATQTGLSVPIILEMLDKGMTVEEIVRQAQEAKNGVQGTTEQE